MAETILRTALRLQSTHDALLFGNTLSQEERAELRDLLILMRYFKQNVVEKPELQMKIVWRMQFINEAIQFSENVVKAPFNRINYLKGVVQ